MYSTRVCKQYAATLDNYEYEYNYDFDYDYSSAHLLLALILDCSSWSDAVTFVLMSMRIDPVGPLTFPGAVFCPVTSMTIYRRWCQAEVETPIHSQFNASIHDCQLDH